MQNIFIVPAMQHGCRAKLMQAPIRIELIEIPPSDKNSGFFS